MSRFALVLTLVVLVVCPAVAEDWTGKKIKAKDDLKPGKRDGAGLIRSSDVVKKGTELTVKADDGTFLELDGKLGTIFKTEAVLVSNDPNALPSDGTTWTAGTPVFERERDGLSEIELRTVEGLAVVANWIPLQTPTVVRDGNDGTVLVTDGKTEGWVKKKNLMTLEDVPVWVERQLKANPKDVFALCVRTNALGYQQEYAEVEKGLTVLIKLVPTEPVYPNRRGWARMRLDDFDGAVQDFNEVLRLDPNSTEVIPYRGYCRLRMKEYAKADADLSDWLKSNPGDAEWLAYRAQVRFHLREWEKSLADAEAALKADPKRSQAVPYKALALAKLKRYQEAKDCFEKGTEDDPTVTLYVAYARFMSTYPDEKFRDAVGAVRLMKLTQGTFEQQKREMPAEHLEVFAAAYAEGGLFEEAIEKQKEAIERMKADKKTPAAELKRAEAALELYKKNKPLRDE